MNNQLSLFESGVYMSTNHDEVITDTLQVTSVLSKIYKQLNKNKPKRHSDILAVTRRLIKNDSIGKRNISLSSYQDSQNKKRSMYRLDEKATIILCTSLSGDTGDLLRSQFVDMFLMQKEELEAWRSGRKEVKKLTKHTNGSINEFIVYAESMRGSKYKGTPRYFNMFQKQINQVVIGLNSFNRDKLPKEYLLQINSLEDVLSESLITLMNAKLEYHKIAKLTLKAIRDISCLNMEDAKLVKYNMSATYRSSYSNGD
ncbi:MAG: Rha family transcriptional regulator [Campylobacterota bacterium]|nr:Rha family transcriptional regulator [Campylobacterota bacterium]